MRLTILSRASFRECGRSSSSSRPFCHSSCSAPANKGLVVPFHEFWRLTATFGLYSSFLWTSRRTLFAISLYLASSASLRAIFSALESKSSDFFCKSSIITSISSSFVHFLNNVAAVALPNSPAFYRCLISWRYRYSKSCTKSCCTSFRAKGMKSLPLIWYASSCSKWLLRS